MLQVVDGMDTSVSNLVMAQNDRVPFFMWQPCIPRLLTAGGLHCRLTQNGFDKPGYLGELNANDLR